MKNLKKGFIPVMLTPFKENGNIDFDALTQLTKFYAASGSSGLFANCLSSEMYELTPEERLKATRHIVDVVNGTIPVVASGNFGENPKMQAEFIKRMHDTGVEAVILITSLIAGEAESDEVFNERILNLIHMTDGIPLGFYECPVPYKRLITPEQLKSFIATGRIIYHKDTCLDIAQVKNKIAVGKGYNFGLYDAYMGHAVESLQAGSAGLSCIQGNFFPELIVWLCENYNASNSRKEVEKVQGFLRDNMDVMHRVYPQVAKYYLQKRGLDISLFTRAQRGVIFNATVKNQIDQLFKDYSRLTEELNLEVLL